MNVSVDEIISNKTKALSILKSNGILTLGKLTLLSNSDLDEMFKGIHGNSKNRALKCKYDALRYIQEANVVKQFLNKDIFETISVEKIYETDVIIYDSNDTDITDANYNTDQWSIDNCCNLLRGVWVDFPDDSVNVKIKKFAQLFLNRGDELDMITNIQLDSKIGQSLIKNSSESILNSPSIVCSYEAHVNYSSNKVRVILWKDHVIPEISCIDNIPIMFVQYRHSNVSNYSNKPNNSTNEIHLNFQFAEQILRENYLLLFKNHSNLLIAQVICDENNDVVIKFVVPCKGFIPFGEFPLPKRIKSIKTVVVQGWFSFAVNQEENWQSNNPVSFGHSISSNSTSKYGKSIEDPSFFTLGGCFRVSDKLYGVTCGHCFQISSIEKTFEERESSVFAGSFLTRFLNLLKEINKLSLFEDLAKITSISQAINSYLHILADDMSNTDKERAEKIKEFIRNFNDNFEIGKYIGALFGDKIDDRPVDVGLFRINEGCYNDDLKRKSIRDINGNIRQVPSHILELNNLVEDSDFDLKSCTIFGFGAKSEDHIELNVSHEYQIYCRKWQGGKYNEGGFDARLLNNSEPIFDCIAAKVQTKFQPGDSGSWLWSPQHGSQFVGMAFGTAFDSISNDQCVFLPMELINKAVKQMVKTYNVV
mmetsp:Transcript_21786/g.19847  ORF Transcript_21786/g.19847 Transcript_21786/m.19847 type:complete len:649 (+) Transcript_21786:63-2009(+)